MLLLKRHETNTLQAMLNLIKLIMLVCLMAALMGCFGRAQTFTPEDAEIYGRNVIEGERAKVTWVADGDTIDAEIDGEEFRVRYIGVDTPERDEPFYTEASDFNLQLVGDKTVILVKDVSETDQYGRLLRYVYLEDGTFVNEAIIKGGYGRLVTYPPDVRFADYFQELQGEARSAEIGLWGINSFEDLGDAPAGCTVCNRNTYNCSDFNRQTEAQACFDFCLAQTDQDIHNLDGGGDGLVCESLP